MHYQPTENLLAKRIILVTGASDGIGREAAITYAAFGASVILVGRNEDKLHAVAGRSISKGGQRPKCCCWTLLAQHPQIASNLPVNWQKKCLISTVYCTMSVSSAIVRR